MGYVVAGLIGAIIGSISVIVVAVVLASSNTNMGEEERYDF